MAEQWRSGDAGFFSFFLSCQPDFWDEHILWWHVLCILCHSAHLSLFLGQLLSLWVTATFVLGSLLDMSLFDMNMYFV